MTLDPLDEGEFVDLDSAKSIRRLQSATDDRLYRVEELSLGRSVVLTRGDVRALAELAGVIDGAE